MILSLLILLILVSAVFFKLNYKRLAYSVVIFVLLIFLLISYGVVPYFLAKQIQTYPINQPIVWKSTNAIILLEGGATKLPNQNLIAPSGFSYSRILQAAKLYHACEVDNNKNICTIIYTGGDTKQYVANLEASAYQAELVAVGVKPQDIILETHSLNTYANAKNVADILKQKHFQQVILTTSGAHMRRALILFHYFGIPASPAPSDYLSASNFSWLPNAYNFAVSDMICHEYLGMLEFYILCYFHSMSIAKYL